MIVALTPNPALDITYRVPRLDVGESHRVRQLMERAGGKCVNTAAVLTSMGTPCTALAPVGEADVDRFAADLTARGVDHLLVGVPGSVRRSVAVVDDQAQVTVLNEAGTAAPAEAWDAVTAHVDGLAAGDVLVVSGSIAPGTPAGLLPRIVGAAHRRGARVVLDVSGTSLSAVLPDGPDLVKPNRAEAAATLGQDAVRPGPAVDLATSLVAAGARSALVSDGAAGLALVSEVGSLQAALSSPLRGNPTGAGDALTAALAAGLTELGDLPADLDTWAELLRRAVAWSAAAVLQPVAGEIDPRDVAELMGSVEVTSAGLAPSCR